MTYERVVTDPAALRELAVDLHDHWFHGDSIEWNRAQSSLTVPFSERWEVAKGWRTPPGQDQFDCQLLIKNVTSWQVQDEAQISIYDLAEISFHHNIVTISSGFPYRLTVNVARLWISYSPNRKSTRSAE